MQQNFDKLHGLAAPWVVTTTAHKSLDFYRDRVDIMETCISATVFCLFQHHVRHTVGITYYGNR